MMHRMVRNLLLPPKQFKIHTMTCVHFLPRCWDIWNDAVWRSLWTCPTCGKPIILSSKFAISKHSQSQSSGHQPSLHTLLFCFCFLLWMLPAAPGGWSMRGFSIHSVLKMWRHSLTLLCFCVWTSCVKGGKTFVQSIYWLIGHGVNTTPMHACRFFEKWGNLRIIARSAAVDQRLR